MVENNSTLAQRSSSVCCCMLLRMRRKMIPNWRALEQQHCDVSGRQSWSMNHGGAGFTVHSAHGETQTRWLHHAVRILPRHSADSLIEHFHFHLQWVFGEIVLVLSPDSWFHARLLAAIHCNQNHCVRVLPWVALGEHYQRWWDQRLLPAPSTRLYKACLQLDRYPGDPLWALERISLPGSNSSASKESHPRRLICLCWP